jgi:Tn3 transposase DDE domain
MDRLELPNRARRLPDRLHTSSDGQKFEVRVDSLNANYSFKYFRLVRNELLFASAFT